MQEQINDFYDVLQLLKKYGFIVYFKDNNDTLEMIEQEINSLYHYNLLSKHNY
ncbi:TPA: YqgQ family protein, partial [Escherichia coli]|nr:YqgQ family protein [Escherichia coli]